MIEATPQQAPSVAADATPSDAVTGAPAREPVQSSGLFALIRGFRPSTTLFWGVHVAAVIMAPSRSSRGPACCSRSACYFVRMVVVTAAYHRYFSHRAFKTSRAFQFLLALGAQSSAQKGVLWWAAHHRHHHKHSDTEDDIHSARRSGFWHSHIGWILVRDWDETRHDLVTDLAKFPELRILNHSAGDAAAGDRARRSRSTLLGGWDVLIVGLPRLERDALARIVFDQLAVAPVRQAALRDVRRFTQQLGARDPHDRRGLAQQPPPLPELRQPGLPLVGDRRDVLRAARARALRPGLGSAPPVARCHRRRA